MATRLASFVLCTTALLSAAGLSPARAQTESSARADVRPNLTRAVRLTFLAGAVRVQRSDNTGDDTAVLNMPIPEGSRIVTADYGQAELEFEDGSVARLTPNSALALNVLALEPGPDSTQVAHTELTLLGGLAYFEIRKSSASSWLLSAGAISLQPLQNLTLRLAFDQPPPAFAMLTGAARLTQSHGFDTDVRAGETLRPDANETTRYFLSQQIVPESWDAWNESRDQAAADAADRRTAARDNYAGGQGYGWSDLDASGSWYDVPGTGQVWQPSNADEGFDPYGYGAWVWGNGSYVWASGYQWGWTPFRCGHWEYFPSFGWGWQPDARCSLWSFAGGGYLTAGLGNYGGYGGDYGAGGGTYYGSGIFIRGPHPPRHPTPIRPQPRPGQPHPIVPVRGPDGPRPPTLHRGQARIAGSTVVALPTIAPSSSRSGSSLGRGIAPDFPVDRATRQPIFGTESLPPAYSSTPPDRSGQRPAPRSPRQSLEAAPAGASTATTPRRSASPGQSGSAPPSAPGAGHATDITRAPNSSAVSPAAPVQTVRPTASPIQQQPAPPRYTPPPPAPAPPPPRPSPPPAPAPAPAPSTTRPAPSPK